jgi:uncharacterized protein (TIGR02246 family)
MWEYFQAPFCGRLQQIRRNAMQMRSLMLGLIMILLFTACGHQSAPGKASIDTSADIAAIRATVEKFVAAWNKGDSVAYSPMVAADAILMQPDGPLLQGRDAIVLNMTKAYNITTAQQTATVDEVIVTGDHAYAHGTWNLNPTAEADAGTKALKGKWSVLYQRSADGTWLAFRWMWNQEAAPSPVAPKPAGG